MSKQLNPLIQGLRDLACIFRDWMAHFRALSDKEIERLKREDTPYDPDYP